MLRWECPCTGTPILLAMYWPGDRAEIKVRDRCYVITGTIHTACPRCGTHHTLQLADQQERNVA